MRMKNLVVKGKLLVGPILALVGGAFMLFSSVFVFASIGITEASLAGAGLTWADVGFPKVLMYVRFGLTLLWGVLGLIGGIISITGKKFGAILALIGGFMGFVGTIPTIYTTLGTITIIAPEPVSLSASFLFVDPILVLVGGILVLALRN